MIEVIHYQYDKNEKTFEGDISHYYTEVRKLLPELPEKMHIFFSDTGIIPETGIGGHAHNSEIVTISIDPDFKDKHKQAADIRPTIFHEAFHVYQNFTYEGPQYPALEGAVYEGMATVFERQYADTAQPYGDWNHTPVERLKQWVTLLKNIDQEEYEQDWQQWKFYHDKFHEQWIAYKAGVFVVDTVLSRYKLDILDLRDKSAEDVLNLYGKQLV